MPESVVAVIAAYRPSPDLLDGVRAALAQAQGVVVVDDGSGPGPAEEVLDAAAELGAVVLRRPENAGIAAALNAGIAAARRRWTPEFVLTLDQDSVLAAGYVERAVDTYRRASASGLRVGLVAAAAYGEAPTPTRRSPDAFGRAFDPMQSGTLIPAATLDAVGGLDEDLVIDGVDSEYTARVNAAGLAVLVGDGCVLEHQLGRREPATVFGRPLVLGGRPITYNYHSPTRVYYIARNGTLLTLRYLRRDPAWVGRRLVEEAKAHGMRLVLGRDKLRLLRAMAAGGADAVAGRTGRVRQTRRPWLDDRRG